MNKKYEILEHPSDLKIKAYGQDLIELFSNALFAMFENIQDKVGDKRDKVLREIKIHSSDLSSLLVDFLSEALYFSDIHNEAYFNVKIDKLTENEIRGQLEGIKVKSFKKANISCDIKKIFHSF